MIKLEINKIHYKTLGEPKRIYIDAPEIEIRKKLNIAFHTPTAEDNLTGIVGKYSKPDKMYKLKYIYTRNKQLQPQTFDRYFYLVDVSKDEKGSYIEYVMVYDRLFDPIIRAVYLLAVFAVLMYLVYAYKIGAMTLFSAVTLGVIVAASSAIVFKKSKETKEECEKAENLFKKLISQTDFC